MSRHLRLPGHDTLSTKGEFDDLFVVEILTDPQGTPTTFQTDARGKFIAWLKKDFVPYFPGSSCQRHVYLLRKSDLEKYFASRGMDEEYILTTQDKLVKEILSGSEEYHNLTVHTAENAMVYLTKWIAGGLNKIKYLQDTYNVTTVTTGFKCFKTLSSPDGLTSLNARKLEIDEEISHNQDPKSERSSWLREEKEEIDRVVKFFNPEILQKNSDFVSYLERVFEVANKLSSVLQSLKEIPNFKGLWSGDITKLTLSIAEKKDVPFFQRVLSSRTKFVDTLGAALVFHSTSMVAKDDLRAAAMDSIRSLEEEISTLSAMAKDKKKDHLAKILPVKEKASEASEIQEDKTPKPSSALTTEPTKLSTNTLKDKSLS